MTTTSRSLICFAATYAVGLAFLTCPKAQAQTKLAKDGAQLLKVAEGYKFTEGPAADKEGNVYFTDQPNDRILRWDANTQEVSTWLQPCGRSNGLFFDNDGSLIACADEKNELWRINVADKSHKILINGFDDKLLNGPNDVWIAQDGSKYFTDPFYKRPYWQRKSTQPELPKRVYRLAPSGQVTVVAENFKQPNGIIGNSKTGLLYVADIGDKKTYRFKLEDGQLTERKLFCSMGSDGMTLDEQGNLYLTGNGVTVFSPAGKQIAKIEVPEKWTANICFGGAEKQTLFITASDSLYSLETTMRGL